MGIRERHERDREAMARAILDAARDLFTREGYANVSIRKIAERIEYSPAAIYGYFPSKDDIFFALAEEGFRLLFSFARGVAKRPDEDPADTLRQMFWRYYEFSREHPEYFALMFLDRSVPRIRDHWDRFGFVGEMKHDMVGRIQKAIGAGACPGGTPAHTVFRLLLTAAHGAAALRLCDRLAPGEDGDVLARATIDAALLGIRAGAGRDLPDSSCIHPDSEATRHDS